jgi:5S rRNA maturation endonuclease (ribonuclease M5)
VIYFNFKELRQIDLNLVIQDILYGIEVDTKDTYRTRKYILPSNNNIAVTGMKWFDNTDLIGGNGALDLLIHVKSITLLESATILSKFEKIDYNQISAISNENIRFCMPLKCDSTWFNIYNYLKNTRGIPEYLINDLYNKSLLWSDDHKNCVFPRDLNSGAFLRGTIPGIQFKRTIGINGRPFIIPGNNELIITEAPIDAISLKYYYKNATIMATGGRIGFDKIEIYIKNATKIFLAHDNDVSGDSQANKIAEKIEIKSERLRPLYNLKDWNEVLKHEKVK